MVVIIPWKAGGKLLNTQRRPTWVSRWEAEHYCLDRRVSFIRKQPKGTSMSPEQLIILMYNYLEYSRFWGQFGGGSKIWFGWWVSGHFKTCLEEKSATNLRAKNQHLYMKSFAAVSGLEGKSVKVSLTDASIQFPNFQTPYRTHDSHCLFQMYHCIWETEIMIDSHKVHVWRKLCL